MTVTMYTTNITISVMYRVGFLKKSMLEKTKFQSMVFGTTTQPPANVVMWVHLQWMPLLFVNGPTLVSTFIMVFKNHCYYKQGEIQCISWNIEYQALKPKMWCWWKTFIVKTQIKFLFFLYISYTWFKKDIRAVFEPQIKYLDRVQIFFLYIHIPYIFSNCTGIGNRYILI